MPAQPQRPDTTVLVVDDDPDVLTAARLLLKQHVGAVHTRERPDAIPEVLAAQPVDVVLLDMNFAIGEHSGREGMTWLRRVQELDPATVVVLMTAFGALDTAVTAMREGAADFVLKPWQNEKLVATINMAAALARERRHSGALSARQQELLATPDAPFIANDPAMAPVLELIARAGPTDANVLVRGENGTGKELVARALHRASSRAQAPMLGVDLGAVAEGLFESELFGHVRGAFTDARDDRAGRFQAASGGTLFLDEVGNLPAHLQSRLLRALETREVTPVGADRAVPVDVRLISATNRPLEDLVASGGFRADLLYRINTVEVHLPALRQRPADILPLARHFIASHCRRYGLPLRQLDAAAADALLAWSWPGNVRELAHAMERAVILAQDTTIQAAEVLPGSAVQAEAATPGSAAPQDLNLEAHERHLVRTALKRHGGNVSHAATALGITRAALYRRMEKFGL